MDKLEECILLSSLDAKISYYEYDKLNLKELHKLRRTVRKRLDELKKIPKEEFGQFFKEIKQR